ncbi:MAG: hypothetical protein AAF988_01435, partial [Pseudomonadota bacterium]
AREDGIKLENKSYNKLFHMQNIFRAGFFSYFFVLPFLFYAFRTNWVGNIIKKLGYAPPEKKFTLTVFAIIFIYFIGSYLAGAELRRAVVETREMLYAWFIMLYVILYLNNNNSSQATEYE